jgi:uncharacterized membrane protein
MCPKTCLRHQHQYVVVSVVSWIESARAHYLACWRSALRALPQATVVEKMEKAPLAPQHPAPAAPPAAHPPAVPEETPAQKKVRIAKEREAKKREREEAKDAREAQREAKREQKIRDRVLAGEDLHDIQEQARMAEITSKASAQLKRYTAIKLKSSIPLCGIENSNPTWSFLQETRAMHVWRLVFRLLRGFDSSEVQVSCVQFAGLSVSSLQASTAVKFVSGRS